MHLPNYGAISVWWKMNNKEDWKTYMQVLYSVVNTNCGEFVMDRQIAYQMQLTYFASPADIATNLFTDAPSQEVSDAIFTDPWYGLQNFENYPRWQVLE